MLAAPGACFNVLYRTDPTAKSALAWLVLQDFLAKNRQVLIERCAIAAGEAEFRPTALEHGIPVFLAQVITSLGNKEPPAPLRSRAAIAADASKSASDLGNVAALHGGDLLERGFTLDHVVRDYGNFCQAVMNLAHETGSPIEVEEFATFNRCLDEAIAAAVTEFARRQSLLALAENDLTTSQPVEPVAHELRQLLDTATLAVRAIKAGNVGIAGATGLVLDRSLLAMQGLVDRSLAETNTAVAPRRG
jgi:hypothetical protein